MRRILSFACAMSSVFALQSVTLQAAELFSLTTQSTLSDQEKTDILEHLEPGITLREIKRQSDKLSGYTHVRYEQLYRGIPIRGYHLLVALNKDQEIATLHGTLVKGVDKDLLGLAEKGRFSPSEILAQRKQAWLAKNISPLAWTIRSEQASKVVFIDGQGKARYAVLTSFFADLKQGGRPTRPTSLVDDMTGEVLKEYEGLTTAEATGPGGNLKIGRIEYGTDFLPLDVSYNAELDRSTLVNDRVATFNANGGEGFTEPFSFSGTVNTYKEINGAYSPLNDAHFFGGEIFRMYAGWLNTQPLNDRLSMVVHYGDAFENAFYVEGAMYFGDGGRYFHPLVSLDVAAHEVSHGFTEQNSGLIYEGESGGMNEAFSDIAGEAVEFFSRGTNDFLIGHDIFKLGDALRFMDHPAKDGASIESDRDYDDSLDVHYTSGVYNKAFYQLAHIAGWDTKMAFLAFALANQHYWEPKSTFLQGAIGVCHAARDLGYDSQAVEAAFASVDLIITDCTAPAGQVVLADAGTLQSGQRVHYAAIPAQGKTRLVAELTGSGDADLYIRVGKEVTQLDWDCRPYKTTSNERCRLKLPVDAGDIFVMVRGALSETDAQFRLNVTLD